MRKCRLCGTGSLPHQANQPQRIDRGDNAVKEQAVKQLDKARAIGALRLHMIRKRRVIPINQQHNLFITCHTEELD